MEDVKTEKSLDEMIAEQKSENLKAFVDAVNEAGKKYKCKLVAQVVLTQGIGAEYFVVPVNE